MDMKQLSINDLPDEILCHIFRYVEPYEDLDSCNLICERWSTLVTLLRNQLKKATINNFKLGRIKDCAIDTKFVPAIYQICKHKNDFYAMKQRTITWYSRDDSYELLKLNLTSMAFEHVATTGDIPRNWCNFQLKTCRDDLVFFDAVGYGSNAMDMYFCNIVSRSWVKRRIPETPSLFGLRRLILAHEENFIFYYHHPRNARKLHVFSFTTMKWRKPKELNPPPRELPLCHIYTADNNFYFLEPKGGAVWKLKFNLASKHEAWSWTKLVVENSHQQLNIHEILNLVSCTVDECAFCLVNLIANSDCETVALVVDFSRALTEDKVKVEPIRLSLLNRPLRFIQFTGIQFIINGKA